MIGMVAIGHVPSVITHQQLLPTAYREAVHRPFGSATIMITTLFQNPPKRETTSDDRN
jgi:hypothetical protein